MRGVFFLYYSANELYHHGILGQKWGVRRYQNEDGSLTAAGKSRYSGSDQKVVRDQSNSDGKNKMQSDTKKKIAIAAGVGATVVAAGLVIYGAKRSRDIKVNNNVKDFVQNTLNNLHSKAYRNELSAVSEYLMRFDNSRVLQTLKERQKLYDDMTDSIDKTNEVRDALKKVSKSNTRSLSPKEYANLLRNMGNADRDVYNAIDSTLRELGL